jgi:hypothetical protein
LKFKVTLLLLLVITLCSFKGEKRKIKGTWKIVSEETIINGERSVSVKDENHTGLKTWSDDYYMFLSKSVNGSAVSQTFGGGRYDLNGNNYVEYNDYHVAPNYRGRLLKIHLEIKKDTLTQIYPCDDNFNFDINNCNIQKYIKLD